MVLARRLEIDPLERPSHRPVDLPHQLARNSRIVGDAHIPGVPATAAVRHVPTIPAGYLGRVLATHFTVWLERVIGGPPLGHRLFVPSLGLEAFQDVEDVVT